MKAHFTKKCLCIPLGFMLVFSGIPAPSLIYAADLINTLTNSQQPEVSVQNGNTDSLGSTVVPSGTLFSSLSALSSVQPPAKPTVSATGYNSKGRRQFPGYVAFTPIDGNNFSYRYDVGAASGATVDVVIARNSGVMDLSGGYQFRLKRVNRVPATEGISEISVVFIDSAGIEVVRRIQLSSDFTAYNFTLDDAGFDAKSVTKVILRQTYTDIDQATYQNDRRGEIFVNLTGLDVPESVTGTAFDQSALTKFPDQTSVQSRGFIRGDYSRPGYVTLLTPTEETRAFRYDVGASSGAVVQTDLLPPVSGGVFELGAQVVLAMKNSVTGMKALVHLMDAAGVVKEFILTLTDSFQNYVLDLDDGSGLFDYTQVKEFYIEVTRKLSSERRGRIDFYFLRTAPNPITSVTPVVSSVSAPIDGQCVVSYEPVNGALLYQVQVAKDANFTNLVYESSTANVQEAFLLTKSGQYYVRVRASSNANLDVGPLSQWGQKAFVADVIYDKKPAVTSVITREEDKITQIKFVALTGAVIYQVQVARDAAFTDIAYEGFPSSNVEEMNLKTDGTYYVRVRASLDTDFTLGLVSQWTDLLSFKRETGIRNIMPTLTLTANDITSLPDGEAGPILVTSVGPGTGGATDAAEPTAGGVLVDFNTGTAGWSGGGFSYDVFDDGTTIETGDLSTLSRLVFGIRGNAETVKLEMVDDQGNKSSVHLNGIKSTEEQYWSIAMSLFSGIDLTNIRLIYFIVEGEGKSGQLAINCIAPANRDAFTQIVPVINKVEMTSTGNGKVTFAAVTGAVGYRIQVATDAAFENLVYEGYPSTSPEEFSLTTDGNYYVRIEALKSSGLRPGRVSQWSEVKILARTYNSREILPNFTLTASDITSLPDGEAGPILVTSVGPGTGGAVDKANPTAGGVLVDFNTGIPGWSGGGFTYDVFDDGTAIETGDLSALSRLVFGIRGDSETVKLEIVDDNGNKSTVHLNGVRSTEERYWSIAMSLFSDIDLAHVRLIYFIVEGDGKSGQLAINCIAPANRDAFTQIVPVINKVEMTAEGNGTVAFTAVTGAVGYRVQVATDVNFSDIVYEGYPPVSPDGFSLTTDGNYYVRIEALKSSGLRPGRVSQWSEVKTLNRIYDGLNISPDAGLTAGDITSLPAGEAGPILVTSVGPGTGGAVDKANPTAGGVLVDFNTGTAGWSGGGFTYDVFDDGTTIETGDLSALARLVFGIRGDSETVKLEIVDDQGKKSSVHLNGIKSTEEQYWSIAMSLFSGIDLKNIRLIYFIVEGAGKSGQLAINCIAPANRDAFTQIVPVINTVEMTAEGNGTVAFTAVTGAVGYRVQVATDVNFSNLVYEGYPPVSPDGFSLTTDGNYYVRIEALKSSGLRPGRVSQWSEVKTLNRIYDGLNISPDAGLTAGDITSLPAGEAGPILVTSVGPGTGGAVDKANPTAGGVLVDFNTGTAGWSGGGFTYDVFDDGTTIETGDLSALARLVFGIRGDSETVKLEIVDGQGKKSSVHLNGIKSTEEQYWSIAMSLFSGIDLTNIRLIYFIVEGEGKSGQLAINCIVPANRDAFTQIVPVINKVEMTAVDNGTVTFTAVTGAVGYRVQVATDVNFSNIVYEGYPSTSPDSFSLTENGHYYVRIQALKSSGLRPGRVSQWSEVKTLTRNYQSIDISPDSSLGPQDITNFPDGEAGALGITSVGPGTGGATDSAVATTRGVQVTYNTGTAGWSGGGFSYDNFSTTAIETGDLSALDKMVFGIKGDASSVKLEIVNASGLKASVYLHNIKSDIEQYWSIPMSLFSGIDLAHVRLIYFIVEGENLQGQLNISNIKGIPPSTTLTTADIVDFSNGAIDSGTLVPGWTMPAGQGASGNLTPIDRGGRFNYATSNADWITIGFSWDNESTTQIESIDLAAQGGLTFGLKGNYAQVKLAFVDANGKAEYIPLIGIQSGVEQVWSIPTSVLDIVDAQQITSIFFLIEGKNKTGYLCFYHKPTST